MKRSSYLRVLYALVAVLAVLFLAGCTPSIVGKWQGDLPMPEGQKIPVQMEFKQDGSLLQKLGPVSVTGTYTVDGDKMTLNLTEANLAGKKIPFKGVGAASGNVGMKFEGENLILTGAGEQPLVMTRVKE
jgi:hypothetical protein